MISIDLGQLSGCTVTFPGYEANSSVAIVKTSDTGDLPFAHLRELPRFLSDTLAGHGVGCAAEYGGYAKTGSGSEHGNADSTTEYSDSTLTLRITRGTNDGIGSDVDWYNYIHRFFGIPLPKTDAEPAPSVTNAELSPEPTDQTVTQQGDEKTEKRKDKKNKKAKGNKDKSKHTSASPTSPVTQDDLDFFAEPTDVAPHDPFYDGPAELAEQAHTPLIDDKMPSTPSATTQVVNLPGGGTLTVSMTANVTLTGIGN